MASHIDDWLKDYIGDSEVDRRKYGAKGNSTDLKAADFKGKNLKLVISSVDDRTYPARENQAEQTKTVLAFEGKELVLVRNATNNDILCDAYGDDDDNWPGHEIGLSTVEHEGFGTGWHITPLDVEPAEFSDEIPFN